MSRTKIIGLIILIAALILFFVNVESCQDSSQQREVDEIDAVQTEVLDARRGGSGGDVWTYGGVDVWTISIPHHVHT